MDPVLDAVVTDDGITERVRLNERMASMDKALEGLSKEVAALKEDVAAIKPPLWKIILTVVGFLGAVAMIGWAAGTRVSDLVNSDLVLQRSMADMRAEIAGLHAKLDQLVFQLIARPSSGPSLYP